MLKNYIIIAFRSIYRRPVYTFLNITGLSAGMAVCLLIGLYVHDEWQVDRFHEHADRIVQIGQESRFSGGRSVAVPYPLASTLKSDVPVVEDAVRIHTTQARISREPNNITGEFRVLHTEEAFFRIFSFPVIKGDIRAALDSPDGMLISESMAQRFFGDDDPLGEELIFGEGSDAVRLTVRGVVEDVPQGSTIQYDVLVPLSLIHESWRRPDGWGASVFTTHALLQPLAEIHDFTPQLQAAVRPHFEEDMEPPAYFAVPFTSVYLSDLYHADGFRGQMRYLYLFGFAALFVLFIAGVNYINLSTALGTRRALEIGVRKTMGAARHQLARQFLTESILLSFASLFMALVLMEVLFPFFNHLFETELTITKHTGVLAGLIMFVFLTGIAAGGYPALVLSRFNPVTILSRNKISAGSSRFNLRGALVVVQFAISSFLIIGILVIYYQLHFMQTTNLGFEGEQVVFVDMSGTGSSGIREDLRRQIQEHPGIVRATAVTSIPGGRSPTLLGAGPEEISPTADSNEETIFFQQILVDSYFLETLEISLIDGRNFSGEYPAGGDAYILNEAAAEALGWSPDAAAGQPFRFGRGDSPSGEVIGVVQDFHLSSLHQEIGPVILQHEGAEWGRRLIIAAKLAPHNIPDALRHIERVLAPLMPPGEFSYRFLDDAFHELYHAEQRLSGVVTAFAILSILIACLGLFGLAAFSAERRTKEIGIRKVMGATVAGIVSLLGKDFLKLVLLGFVIAVPVAWYAMNQWLQDFAYRIEIGPGIFVIAGGMALLIALVSVGWQSVKAALMNPVESLRSE